jgi:hypothetical protein
MARRDHHQSDIGESDDRAASDQARYGADQHARRAGAADGDQPIDEEQHLFRAFALDGDADDKGGRPERMRTSLDPLADPSIPAAVCRRDASPEDYATCLLAISV